MIVIVFTRLLMWDKAAAIARSARGWALRGGWGQAVFVTNVTLMIALVLLGSSGCDQVRGRRLLQQANAEYHDGNYKEAVRIFKEAEQFLPDFPLLHLNKGYTCKQLIVPGAKTPESIVGADCAIKSFKRYMDLKPEDPRGEMLYTQTLFDADRFSTLAEMYEQRYAANHKDSMSVAGLMQVYTKWEKMDEALKWYQVNLEIKPNDAEAYYGAGTFIYNQLLTKGGGTDKQNWDPRPGAVNAAASAPPVWVESDIQGQQRVDLAEAGIRYLEKAVELRPMYTDAMAYVNLLWRQKAFAMFDQPAEWQLAIDKSTEWAKKTMEILNQGHHAAAPAEGGAAAAAASPEPAKATKAAPKNKPPKGHKPKGKK
jgi:tetratricopeptide (TPR) repeat protein